MEIKLSAGSPAAADTAEAAALSEIKRLDHILSGYDRTSEFSRWSRTQGEPTPVSPELMEVLNLWDVWRARSGGALNPSAEAIARVWKSAEAAGRKPTPVDLQAAVIAAGQPQWRLDPDARQGCPDQWGAADAELLHQELHHRTRRVGRPCAPPESTASS